MSIKFFRKERGLSQKQLANKVNVSQQAVAAWESGRAYPRSDTLVHLAEVLGATADDLLRKEG